MNQNKVINFCKEGKCSNCGKCCSDILPLDKFEIKKIENYIKQHKIKESVHSNCFQKVLDLTCPFRDNKNKKCLIYPVRPQICKTFICCSSQEKIDRDKRIFNEKKETYSMRNLFYNGKPLNEIFLTLLELEMNSKGE